MKTATKTLISALGLALITGMAISQPKITTSDTSIQVNGITTENGALLKVVGPEGYRFATQLAMGENGSFDLKNTPFSPTGEALSSLPQGVYTYELLSRPGGKIIQGQFRIGAEKDTAIDSSLPVNNSEQNPLDERTATIEAAVVADDSLTIDDTAQDGTTLIVLNDALDTVTNWKIMNNNGDFVIQDLQGNIALTASGTTGETSLTGGKLKVATNVISTEVPISIGGTAAIYPLEISHTTPAMTLTDTDGGTTWKLQNEDGRFSIAKSGLTRVVVIEEDAAHNSLVISAAGVSVLSSRSVKTNIRPTSAEDVLAQLEKLPIYTWSYKGDDSKAIHIGPIAEEFHEQFGFGNNKKRISTMDTGGLALAGVKALQQELAKRDAEIAELKKTVTLLLQEKQ